MTGGATVTLYAVDLADAERRWRSETLAERVAAVPGGRIAALAQTARAAAPGKQATLDETAAALSPLEARALFEGLLEDLAVAAVHDAPFSPLAEICDRLARRLEIRALELAALEAGPLVYPTELRAEPRADTADGRAAFVVWLEAGVKDVVEEAPEDLAEALAAVLRAGKTVVGQLLP